jgi:hypothetical protein
MVDYTIDTGYVVINPDNLYYYTANDGVYKTERNARKFADRKTKITGKPWKVVKVKLVVVEEK